MNQTLLGFDFGMKRIGVAVGQTVSSTASPLFAIQAKDGIPNQNKLAELIKNWQPDALVVGVPLNMDASEQHTSFAARKFAKRLQHTFKLTVHFYDERLTTVEAKSRLFELGGYKKLEAGKIDSVAACLILEGWMGMH
jgi:putative Holliday junction resolvase